jgi:hypothetical protein
MQGRCVSIQMCLLCQDGRTYVMTTLVEMVLDEGG